MKIVSEIPGGCTDSFNILNTRDGYYVSIIDQAIIHGDYYGVGGVWVMGNEQFK